MNNSGIGDKMTVPYGFKAKANRIAIGIRHQLRLAEIRTHRRSRVGGTSQPSDHPAIRVQGVVSGTSIAA